MALPIIARLIIAGIPAVKIIAKYGKKAYNEAKDLYSPTRIKKDFGVRLDELKKLKQGKDVDWKSVFSLPKKFKDKKGGKIKAKASKYSKGGGVRSSKYKL